MVIFKVRTFHKQLNIHETFFFMTLPTVSEMVGELLKIRHVPLKKDGKYISDLMENVRKYGMPDDMENILPGGSTVKQWYNADAFHLGYIDIATVKVIENHHQPHEPEQEKLI